MFQRSLAATLRVSTQLRRRPMSNALRMRPADRAAQLAEKYGLEIATFSHPVLSVVDTVLSRLPKAHIRGGFVHAIARGGRGDICVLAIMTISPAQSTSVPVCSPQTGIAGVSPTPIACLILIFLLIAKPT